jgi:hypothetical protein
VRLFDAGFHAGCLCSESEFFFSPLVPHGLPGGCPQNIMPIAHQVSAPALAFFGEQPKLVQAASEIGASGRSVPLRTFVEILTSFSCPPIYV